MIPKSISATALSVAELCLARYQTEFIARIPRVSGNMGAANVGTACHGALENYVMRAIKTDELPPEEMTIALLYDDSYKETFDTSDTDTEEYADGLALVKNWWARTSFDGFQVLSCEIKESFPVPLPDGTEWTFNYIWDRCDKMDEEGYYRVVDYKTTWIPVQPNGLMDKIQARCYALAAQIKFPDAQRIKVEFDQLRHEPAGRFFSREDNIATWKYLKRSAERIWAIPDDTEIKELETLNKECRYCPRAAFCETLNSSIDLDSIFKVKNADDAVLMKFQIESRMAAEKRLLDELDDILIRHAENNDLLEWETEEYKAVVTARKTRNLDKSRALSIIGPELSTQYGNITLTSVDKLLKSSDISDEQKKQLKDLIYLDMGDPKVKISNKNPIDTE